MHPSPPRGQTDSPQPSPSCACSHPPWEGKGALRKSLAEHPDLPTAPAPVFLTLSVSTGPAARDWHLTWHRLPLSTTCASPLASPCDGLLVPGGSAPSLPLPPSPRCFPAPLEGHTFLVVVPFCSVSPGLRTLPHHQGPCLFSAAPPVQGFWAPSALLGTAGSKYEGWDPLWGHETSSFSMTQHNPSSPC